MIIAKSSLEGQVNNKATLNAKVNNGVEYKYPALEDVEITPTTEEQKIKSNTHYGYDEVTVKPVTADIDSNIVPKNIAKGVEILGVLGDLEGSLFAETNILKSNSTYGTGSTTISCTSESVSGGICYAIIGSTKEVSAISSGWKLLHKDMIERSAGNRYTAVYFKKSATPFEIVTATFESNSTATIHILVTDSLMPLYEVKTIKNTDVATREINISDVKEKDLIICQETKMLFESESNNGDWEININADCYILTSNVTSKKIAIFYARENASNVIVTGSVNKAGKIATIMRFPTLENGKEEVDQIVSRLIDLM